MHRIDRHNAIIEIISSERIARQEQIVARLMDVGFTVTQASVSRDLVNLGIVKVRGYYASPTDAHLSGFGIINLRIAGPNLIVAKCEAGLASAIAVKIDSARLKEVVGTVAGDDTIFVAVENESFQRLAIKKMWEVLSRQ